MGRSAVGSGLFERQTADSASGQARSAVGGPTRRQFAYTDWQLERSQSGLSLAQSTRRDPRQLSESHWQATRQKARLSNGVVLFIQDGSELNFTHHPRVRGLGRLKKETSQGLLMHSCLALSLETGELGLGTQRVWRREPEIKSRTESKYDCSLRATEYDIWAETLQELEPAPEPMSGVRGVSVGDRASDIYGYFRQAQELGWEVVARAARDRIIYDLSDKRGYLMQWARALAPTE